MQHLRSFVLSEGRKYQDLVPSVDLVQPNRAGKDKSCIGWAYCARTADKDFFLLYFEKHCPKANVSGALPNGKYKAAWFDPRTADWISAGVLRSNSAGEIALPNFPDESTRSNTDWGLKLTLREAR
jgi:hypothetical protein